MTMNLKDMLVRIFQFRWRCALCGCFSSLPCFCLMSKTFFFLFPSGARSGACTESPWGRTGRGPTPPGQKRSEREAEVLRGGLPARHGAVPVHWLPADRWEERWEGGAVRSEVLQRCHSHALWFYLNSLKFKIFLRSEACIGKCWGLGCGVYNLFKGECKAIQHSNELIPESWYYQPKPSHFQRHITRLSHNSFSAARLHTLSACR